VYTARVAEAWRRAGHHVVLLCQERHTERYSFLDAVGTVSARGVTGLTETGVPQVGGRVTLLRPDIGPILPVFVLDEYEGFEAKRFVDLSEEELEAYLDRNVDALRAAIEWHGADVVVTGHAVPGAVIGRRAIGRGRYVAKVHGSDLEYAVRPDERYRGLARAGLVDAAAVAGASRDVLERTFGLVPEARLLGVVVPPGVDERFRPLPRRDALEGSARALDADPDTARGRATTLSDEVHRVLAARDAHALESLAGTYDQEVPDPGAAAALRRLAGYSGPIVGFFGKLISQKGPHLLLQALCLLPEDVRALVVGFGGFREWLHALVAALDAGDEVATRWIAERTGTALELDDEQIRASRGLSGRVTFTGRLDHRYSPGALAAIDVLVVPSVLDEAFGMVVVEAAAAGAPPLVARHSGLAEIAATLERAVPAAGPFSFEPGSGSIRRIARGVELHLGRPRGERTTAHRALHLFASAEWSWDRTAGSLLRAAGGPTR
jgi:glycosyltransferase involved in cell wall biosynthesis